MIRAAAATDRAASRVRLLGTLAAALLLASGAGARASCPTALSAEHSPLLDPPIESFVLENGLRVHLVRNPAAPVATVRIVYDVGARDERPGQTGFAHLFEHLMFKGSRHVPDGGFFRTVRDVGGHINAVTDFDQTDYWSSVPASAVERVIGLEADRMAALRLSEESLENQRRAIAEEKALRLDDVPYLAVAAGFLEWAWRDTPYGHSPIGRVEDLRAASLEDARNFHARYYTPDNAVLVVAGDFDDARLRSVIERRFGPIDRGAGKPAVAPVVLERGGAERRERDPLAPFPLYAIVWHTVGENDDDRHAVAVLDDLLLSHDGSRLAARIKGRLAFEAYSIPLTLREAGIANLVFAPRTFASFADIQQVVREELAQLRRDGPGVDELCRSVKRRQLALLRSLETNEGLSSSVARGSLAHGDPRAFRRTFEALGGVRREDVRRVANAYFVDDWLTLEISPAGSVRWIKKLLEILPSALGRSLERRML